MTNIGMEIPWDVESTWPQVSSKKTYGLGRSGELETSGSARPPASFRVRSLSGCPSPDAGDQEDEDSRDARAGLGGMQRDPWSSRARHR